MSSQVMKIGSIILSQSERLAKKAEPLNITVYYSQTVFECKVGLVCNFLLSRKVLVEKGKKNITGKYYKDMVL